MRYNAPVTSPSIIISSFMAMCVTDDMPFTWNNRNVKPTKACETIWPKVFQGKGMKKKPTINFTLISFSTCFWVIVWFFLSDNKTDKVLHTIEGVNKILSMVFFSCIIKYFFRQSDSRCQQFEGVSFIESSKKNENTCKICLLCLVRVDCQLLLPNTPIPQEEKWWGRKWLVPPAWCDRSPRPCPPVRTVPGPPAGSHGHAGGWGWSQI